MGPGPTARAQRRRRVGGSGRGRRASHRRGSHRVCYRQQMCHRTPRLRGFESRLRGFESRLRDFESRLRDFESRLRGFESRLRSCGSGSKVAAPVIGPRTAPTVQRPLAHPCASGAACASAEHRRRGLAPPHNDPGPRPSRYASQKWRTVFGVCGRVHSLGTCRVAKSRGPSACTGAPCTSRTTWNTPAGGMPAVRL